MSRSVACLRSDGRAESLKTLFTFPQSVGIAGGRPSSSYYFVASQGNSLFYLDPHLTRPAIPLEVPPADIVPTDPAEEPSDLDAPLAIVSPPAEETMDPSVRWYASAYSDQQLRSYHCDRVKKMPLSGLDPSMLLGFLCKDEADFVDFCDRVGRVSLLSLRERC